MSWQRGLRPAPPPLNPEDDDDYFRGYGSMGRHYGQYGSWGRHRTPNYHNMTQRDVTKLREHWDETNSKVMSRKTQLDAMLADSQRYESKRLEVDAWLHRMEVRLDRMGAVGHTADVLEAQLRDQKAFHAELPSKHHMDLFSQLTQKLIAVYQQDDTTASRR
ncbi:dystrophin-like [Thrips palmi]|uniref:Dystrophin-like n=1 Tax=Thrips palmi TaxID=161013 RepID=A0A6P9A8U8_THRPL|nr:dystrophin-like [Thrips palmi]